MKKILESRILQTILLVIILTTIMAFYGAKVDVQSKIGKMEEKITIPIEGTTTTYRTFTQKEYIEYLLELNKGLYDTGVKLRDNLIACQAK
jgi:hypothetical protein